jgi:hypothetical protein
MPPADRQGQAASLLRQVILATHPSHRLQPACALCHVPPTQWAPPLLCSMLHKALPPSSRSRSSTPLLARCARSRGEGCIRSVRVPTKSTTAPCSKAALSRAHHRWARQKPCTIICTRDALHATTPTAVS